MQTLPKKISTLFIGTFLLTFFFTTSCKNSSNSNPSTVTLKESHEEVPYDSPEKAAEFEFLRTQDPSLGYVPNERLLLAKQISQESKTLALRTMSGYGNWIERGPESDVAGVYGNPRDASNIASTSGRIRATLIDALDATGKTVFVAGIDGGIWKTTDISATPATWVPLSDFLTNLAVSYLAQDPTNANVIYACTGESYNNVDAVFGVGVFKSTDHGDTWTLLPATSTFTKATKMVCDALGNVYLGTDRKSTRLNSSHSTLSRMPSSA